MDQSRMQTPDQIGNALSRARAAFEAGDISGTWEIISGLIDIPGRTAAQDNHIKYLQIGCAVYKVGDLDAANALNASWPIYPSHLPVRYRLAVRQRQTKTAKWLRTSPEALAEEDLIYDFKNSLANYCLWNGKIGTGLALYPSRAKAKLFTKIIPNSLRYMPLPAHPDQDLPRIIIEQGVGDIFMYLSHIKIQGNHETSTFIGLPQYRSLIARWFPNAKFVAFNAIPDDLRGLSAHAAADFLRRTWDVQKSFSIGDLQLEKPTRGVLDTPVFGISWRGGSGQNRREERHIPLQYFLDMLPEDGRYLALQFDLTEEEKKILLADHRVNIPFMDVTHEPIVTLDVVKNLAGVISIDCANWHFAGVSDVPIFAIMNKTPHWFWGKDAKVEDTYPSATTVQKETMTRQDLDQWYLKSIRAWRQRPKERPALPAIKARQDFERPLFVVSIPRSRSSMVMGIFANLGFWVGDTVGANANNPTGYFENKSLREVYLKGILRDLGADPLGISKLPPLKAQPPYPHLKSQVERNIRQQGYKSGPWGFKDPKLTLVWPMFAKAFPHAQWVVLERDRDDVLNSLCNTSFMKKHSVSPEFWKMFCFAYEDRLNQLRDSLPGVVTIKTDDIVNGRHGDIKRICKKFDLPFDPAACSKIILPGRS
ncbi:MAG: sulfotransferase [Planktomarina sp.]